MERSHFMEAVQSADILKAQANKDWNELASEYPYATVVQLLHSQKKETLSQAEKKKLLLHFDNPLHLSIKLGKRSKAAVAEHPKQVETEAVAPKKKMRLQPTEHPIEKKEEVVAEKTKVVAEPITEVVQTEETGKDLNEGKDVLQLINELPEENPIPASTKEDITEVKESEEKTNEDPGDLMVMMSFTDWLQYFKAKKENEEEDKKGRDAIRSAWQKEKLAEAMDDEEDVVPDEIFEKAMKSVSFGDGLVTEPLAELYVQQGKTEKAIELYKKLSLLNPEKRTYFASRIKDLHLLK